MALTIQGFDELYKRLLNADAKKIKPALRKSLRAGAKVVRMEARSRCPVAESMSKHMRGKGYAPGDLRKSLRVGAVARKQHGTIGVSVVTSGTGLYFTGKHYYGGMVQFGTKFQKAQPWLNDAYHATKDAVIDAIKKGLQTALEKLGV